MFSDRPSQPIGPGAGPDVGNAAWVDPYTDDVLAQMRAQEPLTAKVDEVSSLADPAFIGSTIDTADNSVTVYWHGLQPAALYTIVSRAGADGITIRIVAAPFSAAQLHQSRSRITKHMLELGISAIGFDVDGRGSTVHFRTPTALQAAKDALAAYKKRGGHIAATPIQEQRAIAALLSPPGSPAVHISDELSNPQPAQG